MKRLSDKLSGVEKFFSIILLVGLTVVMITSVVFRYFLNAPLHWANEASVYMMAWLTFLGGSLGLKYKSQAAFSLFIDSLPKRVKKVINILTHFIMLLSLLLLLYVSYTWILSDQMTFQRSISIGMPMWIPYMSVSVGLTFAFIHLLANLIDIFRGADVS